MNFVRKICCLFYFMIISGCTPVVYVMPPNQYNPPYNPRISSESPGVDTTSFEVGLIKRDAIDTDRQNEICERWKNVVEQCEKYNSDYSGFKRTEKISKCLAARGFTEYKKEYCPKTLY